MLKSATLLKRDSNTGFSCEMYEFFKSPFFYRTPPVAASVSKTPAKKSEMFRKRFYYFFTKIPVGKKMLLKENFEKQFTKMQH